MNNITTAEAIGVLNEIKERLTSEKEISAINFALSRIISTPARHKYKFTCNVAGDLEDTLSTVIYADTIPEAYERGAHQIYVEHPRVRRVEHEKVIRIS